MLTLRKPETSTFARVALLLTFALLAQSCTRQPIPAQAPAVCPTAERIYVVGHGWHTGLVLKRADLVKLIPPLGADLPEAEHLEIGWGDEAFYQAGRGTLSLALGALFNSTSSALQMVAFSGSPHAYFRQTETVELCADEAAYASVVSSVANSFMRTPEGGVILLGPSQYGRGRFYRANGAFHVRNTCNTWVAQALARAGYPVSDTVVRAEELLSQLRPLAAP